MQSLIHHPVKLVKSTSIPPVKLAQNRFSKSPKIILLALSILIFGDFFIAEETHGAQARNIPQQLYQQLMDAQIKSQEADNKLILNMQKVLQNFKIYCRKEGKFPASAKHVAYLQNALSQIASSNPYADFPYRIAADDPEFIKLHNTAGGDRHKTLVFIRTLPAINLNQLTLMRRTAQAELAEMPGSIVILHDENNVCCLWGAGVDGHPIKDSKTRENIILADDNVMR